MQEQIRRIVGQRDGHLVEGIAPVGRGVGVEIDVGVLMDRRRYLGAEGYVGGISPE